MNNTKLKPCPFCGGKPVLEKRYIYAIGYACYVYCENCECSTPVTYDDIKPPVKKWNMRNKKKVEEN